MPDLENPPAPHRSRQVATVGTMYFGYAMCMVLRTIPTVAGPAMRTVCLEQFWLIAGGLMG